MEIWKDVKGYEGSYQVSDLGRVKSFHCNNEKILKGSPDRKGYIRIGFRKKSLVKTMYIHQVVAVAFLNHTICGLKVIVDHIDNDKINNKADNLQLTTVRNNVSKDRVGCSSKYTGVSFLGYSANIRINGKNKHLGSFKTELEASNAYQEALHSL